ncbi:hypothetical protein MKI84_13050 [Ancylobacter sp. A5.8]|uniref:hypothetical protein n=1 Tax=Ancylobacter gelatini TaxID=2919920 RepID=UPI001F4D6307|nr:hypothetical protein [Ancylobacter gelatini]MCJ8143845.1 hypothetical protein [Ancylobacter gelatini]
MRRKGEITLGQIRRNYPYQLAFLEEHERDLLWGARYYVSCAPRSFSAHIDGRRHVVVAFAEEADLVAFQRHAGGMRLPVKEL